MEWERVTTESNGFEAKEKRKKMRAFITLPLTLVLLLGLLLSKNVQNSMMQNTNSLSHTMGASSVIASINLMVAKTVLMDSLMVLDIKKLQLPKTLQVIHLE